MVKCEVCGEMFNSVSHHLKKHNMKVKEYKEMFPNAILRTEESTKAYSEAATKKYYENCQINFRESASRAAKSKENVSRLIKQNKDPEFIDSQRERLSLLMSDTNKREWKLNYEQCKERALTNLLWNDKRGPRSNLQKTVSDYLLSSGYRIHEEKAFSIDGDVKKVDCYLLDYDLVIEVNGRYWHGDIELQSVEDMSGYQLQGYERDCIKKEYFKDKILFIWEEQVYNDDYKELIEKFIASHDGSCKIG